MRQSVETRWRCACALLYGFILLVSTAACAVEDALSEQAYLQDLPVVLSASRLSQPLSDAPNSMTVIDHEMIKASGFRSIPDLFRLVPGMYVGNAGANTPIVSLNGVSDQYSRRMQVLIDGRSVYLPPFGGVDWLDLPVMIDDVDRIEVVRGPAAASHGSNSFYGVINIITRDAASVKSKSVAVNQGGMGIADVAAHLGHAGENFDYRFSFGYRSDGGDNPLVLDDTSTNRLLNLRSNFRPDEVNSIDFQVGLNNGIYGQGTAGRPEDAFRDIRTRSDFQQLSWIHAWPDRDESRLLLYRINRSAIDPYKCIDYLACNGRPAIPGTSGFATDSLRSQRYELELQNTTQLGAANRMVWGTGIRYDLATQPLLFSSDKDLDLHQSRIFAHDEWRATDAMLVNLGAMYEDDGAGHKNASPRVSVNYHVAPQHTLRASASSATRNPAMVELYLNTARGAYWQSAYAPPAHDLRPEKILSRELGYLGQFGQVSLDGRIYYNRVTDIILLDLYADGAAHSFKNLADADFKGVDISTTYHWENGRLTLNYTRQKTSCWFSSYPTQYSNPTIVNGKTTAQHYEEDYLDLCSQSVPANSGSMLWRQNLSEAFQFSIGYHLRSKVRVTDVTSGFPPESQMRRVDLRIANAFGQKEKSGGGEIALVLQNAFQDNYTGYGTVPQRANLLFKRRTYLTAILNF